MYYYSLIIFLKSIKIETVSEKFINLDDQKILKKRFTVQNFLFNVIERLHSIFKLLNAINQAVVIRKSSQRTMRVLEIIHIFYKNELTYKLEGKYTEWPNPQKAENHACDRQSGLSDSAP